MDYSSSSRTRDSRTGQFNGGIIKFWNEECKCRRRAIVRISESKNNPNKLYYKCEHGTCNFYKFWDPENRDINWSTTGSRTGDNGQQQTEEIRTPGGGCRTGDNLQSGMQTLQLGMQGLTSVVAGMKMVLMMCFCISIISLLGVFLLALK